MRHIKQIFSLFLAFAPWIVFLILAGPSLPKLKIAVIAASLVTIVMWVTKLHRGIILWVGVIFFSWALIAVFGIQHIWTIRHLGVLSNGMLAAGTILSILVRKPFTLEYAKQKTPSKYWDSPIFIRTNYIITGVWALVFLINMTLAYFKMGAPYDSKGIYDIATYSFLFMAVLFSTFYPSYL